GPPAELVPQGCDQEAALRSLTGTTLSSIEFINTTAQVVNIYWLDYNGTRQLYQTLAPGGSYVQSTYLTQPWLAADTSGTCIAIYLPVTNPARAVIRPPSQMTGGGGGYIISTVADVSTANLNQPNGVAVDRAGNLYIANTNTNQVLKLTPTG